MTDAAAETAVRIGLRDEWTELSAEPQYPACPQVTDLDIASDAVDTAQGHGLIDRITAEQRHKILNMRRLVLCLAQKEYGCRGTCDLPADEAQTARTSPETPTPPGQLTSDLLCGLPVGRVEAYAFGNSSEVFQFAVSAPTLNKIGY